jgi:predicted DNA-binding protein
MREPMASKRGNLVQVGTYLPPELAEQLKELSKITRVPQAAYFREAVEDLLRKYEDVLSKAGKPSSTKTRK